MAIEELGSYITYLCEFKVVVCQLCQSCIPPNDPLRHYLLNHTMKKGVYVPVKVRHRVKEYMETLNLCEPDKVIAPNRLIPELRIINEGFVCKFSGCTVCGTSRSSMRTHYYAHEKYVPNNFKDCEETRVQTFFEGHHRKLSYLCLILMIDIFRSV
jgi:hypothetical protein